MNIIVVSHDSFWPLRGGGGLRVYWIVKKLLERKHDVTVIAPFLSLKGVEKEFPKATLVNIGKVSRFVKKKEWVYLKTGLRIFKELRKRKADIVLAHNVVSAFPSLIYSKLKKVPLVYDIDDFTMGLSKYKLVEKYGPLLECYVARHSDKVIAAYSELKRQLRKRNVHNITIVRHGVNLKLFGPRKGKRKEMVVYMGGVEPHDGTLLIPYAAQQVLKKFPTMTFIIIGDGRDFENLRQLVKRLRLEKHFVFKGWTPHHNIPPILAQAKVGLVTHLRSLATDICLPLKGYEYMAMELPFIAPDLNGMMREVGDTKRALIFSAGDADDLGKSIIRLLESATLRKEITGRGRKFVLKECDWPINAEKIVKICEQFKRN
ncbi:glycosyltransferase family 4 protein [Candidatus Woesearchaeota archaeon]|nr:glycosyltransferase family 4 protein [Candidatus Woesearchaeota archaeon]